MTFPAVAATNTSTSSGTTSHSVSLPASISAGDLLLIGLYLEDDGAIGPPSVSTPSGWTALSTESDGGIRILVLFYRVADGGEGGSVTVSTSSAASGPHNSYRVTGYTTPPTATDAATVGAPNPPNHAPGLGALDFLWLAWGADQNDIADMTAPTNYTNIIQAILSSNGPNLGSARRELNASSENPASFGGTNGIATSLCATVAIQPVAASGTAAKADNYRRRRAA